MQDSSDVAKRQSERLALGPFLKALQDKLESLDAPALRTALMIHAEKLSSSEREPFLELFDVKSPTSSGAAALISAADLFAEEVAAGRWAADYFDYSYDDWAIDSEKADELSADLGYLIDGAGECFRSGDLETAARVYTGMFNALVSGYDDEQQLPQVSTFFDGDEAAETTARWLRSLYETTEGTGRAKVIVDAMESSEYVSPDVSLQDMIDASRNPMRDFEGFLEAWIPELRERLRTKGSYARRTHDLLLEATFMHNGLDGLADIARAESVRKAQSYLAWVRAAISANETPAAIAAATEALDVLDKGNERAEIAERLALMQSENKKAYLASLIEAWNSEPTQRRLTAAFVAARNISAKRERHVIEQLAAALDAQQSPDVPKYLAVALYLAAERLDDAAKLLPKPSSATPPTSSWIQQAPSLVIPALLISGTQAMDDSRWPKSLLHQRFINACMDDRINQRWPLDDEVELPDHDSSLEDVIRRALHSATLNADPKARKKWFANAIKSAEQRIDEILAAKQRALYGEAAWLAVTNAEATTFMSGEKSGIALWEAARLRHKRFPAYQQELRDAASRSAIVGSWK